MKREKNINGASVTKASIAIDRELWREFKAQAKKENYVLSGLVSSFIRSWLDHTEERLSRKTRY